MALLLVLASAGMGLLSSCGNNGCEETRESYLYASLKATGKASITKVNAWALVNQEGSTRDSLMATVSNPTSLEFILQPDTNRTRIRLDMTVNDYGDVYQYNDTLDIRYEVYPYFIDMECGCSLFFSIEEATLSDQLFKGITIKNKEITNDEQVNIILTY